MERAAQGRAAGVRIGAGSVPVKDRFSRKVEQKDRIAAAKPKKNAASEGALRRVEQK
jgi:hypothetical protein